jgi:hypothetical protein
MRPSRRSAAILNHSFFTATWVIASVPPLNSMTRREYHYVGPNEIRDAARTQPTGIRISSLADIRSWLTTSQTDRMKDGSFIATFTITLNEELLVAPRRSEHVACASGGPVLSAGEITFDDNLVVIEVTRMLTCAESIGSLTIRNAPGPFGTQRPIQI